MATKTPRINITLEPGVVDLLTILAKQEDRSVASITRELILEALERREDMELSALAKAREKEVIEKKFISHADAWE